MLGLFNKIVKNFVPEQTTQQSQTENSVIVVKQRVKQKTNAT